MPLVDDTITFIKNLKSLQSAIDLFQNFQNCSGLKSNLQKTEIIPLGPHRLSPIDLRNKVDKLSINYGVFKTLGIWFCPLDRVLTYKNLIYLLNLQFRPLFL